MTQQGHIFRWDLDKTYLKTEFDSVRDLVRTARLSAEDRENIPGSAALLRAIRDCAPEGSTHRIYFISGSPEQMRGVIEKKFALDGFSPDGFVLKPTFSNLLRGRFRAVRSQVDYKLNELITMRAEAPVGTPETLFGDDAESDAFIYALYADVLAGRVGWSTLRKILKKAGAYADQVDAIQEGLESIIHEDPVRRIIIHLDRRTPPVEFQAFFPLVVPIYSHLQTAIVLCLDDTLSPNAIRDVAYELLTRYGTDEEHIIKLGEDILRRRRWNYPTECIEKLADGLTATKDAPWAESDAPDEQARTMTSHIIERIADLALHLKDRPNPSDAAPAPTERDYLEIWANELKRREAIKAQLRLETKEREIKEREAKEQSKASAKKGARALASGRSPAKDKSDA
ncbi:MAG: hypothetical protein H6729_17315 [Deltaproteobacteria bacterium]|nr:hypothetical protein [Deltaproteobacteria bacterium]